MTLVPCPRCQAEVHPLLGPAPLVLGGRVLMCCSSECARLVWAEAPGGKAASRSTGRQVSTKDAGVTSAETRPAAAAEAAKEARAASAGSGSGGGGLVAAAGAVIPSTSGAAAMRAVWGDFALRPAEENISWRARIRGWPLSAALIAVGILLLVLAAYLLLDWAAASPGERAGHGMATPGPETRALGRAAVPRAPPGELGKPDGRGPGPPTPGEMGLLALRQRSFQTLTSFLGSEAVRYRLTAAQVLAEQGEGPAAEVLRRDLGSELWTTRHLAAEALARLGDPAGLAHLKLELGSPRFPVRRSAAYALARAGDPAGLPVLRALTLQPGNRLTACEALAHLGDEGGKRFLRAILVGHEPTYDRLRAAVALGLAGDRSGIELLKARLAEPGMHLGVALALHQLGSPEAVPALKRALAHSALRVEAARALWIHGDLTGLDDVGPALDSASAESRLTGAASIVILTAQARAEVR